MQGPAKIEDAIERFGCFPILFADRHVYKKGLERTAQRLLAVGVTTLSWRAMVQEARARGTTPPEEVYRTLIPAQDDVSEDAWKRGSWHVRGELGCCALLGCWAGLLTMRPSFCAAGPLRSAHARWYVAEHPNQPAFYALYPDDDYDGYEGDGDEGDGDEAPAGADDDEVADNGDD